jgi:hypothetical protein
VTAPTAPAFMTTPATLALTTNVMAGPDPAILFFTATPLLSAGRPREEKGQVKLDHDATAPSPIA